MLIQAINSKPHSFLLLMFLIFAMDHKIKGKLFLRAILFFPDILHSIIIYTNDLPHNLFYDFRFGFRLGK